MFNRNQISIAVAAVVSVQGAIAQDDHKREVEALRGDDFAIEEVFVTARKREESLQSVPVSIDVHTAAKLEEKGIASLEGIARYTPGLDFETGLIPSDTRISLRGLSTTRGRSNVALMVDGVDVSSESMTSAGSGIGPNLDLLDLERVEVVKGPQSATYGRSAFSGAVNYVSKRPGNTAETKLSIDGNDQGFAKAQASASVPIIQDVLAGSVSLAKTEFGGYYENPNTGGELGNIDSEGAAFSLNWTPNDSFSVFSRTEYSESTYSPRALVQRQSLVNTSASPDPYQLGSVSSYAENRPIPGSGATAADCATTQAYAYAFNATLPPFVPPYPECAPIIVGNLGDASEGDIDLSPNPLTGRDFAGTEARSLSSTLELAWKADAFEFVSLTGIHNNDSRTQTDFDRTNFTLASLGPNSGMFVPPGGMPGEVSQFGVNANSDTNFDTDQLSQEFRLSGTADKLDWLVSALYWTEDMDTLMNQQWWLRDGSSKAYWDAVFNRFIFGDISGSPFAAVDIRTSPVPLPIPMGRDTDHTSLAFSLNYNVTDTLRITGEGRYLEEDISYYSYPISAQNNGLLGLPLSRDIEKQTYSRTDTAFVPRVSVDWQAMESTMFYASIAEGYKPGGTNTTGDGGDITQEAYDPEELLVYEVGVKSNLLDNRLQLNAATYLYDYTKQQINAFVRDPINGSLKPSITNAGKSELFGTELSAVYRPSENWTFYAGYVLSDTEMKDFTIADVGDPTTLDKLLTGTVDGDYTGKQFINSPEDSAMLSIRYDGNFASGAGYFTELIGSYESKRYLDLGNNAYLPEYWLVDFQGGVSFDKLDVIFYVNNLLDDDKVKNGVRNVNFGFMPMGRFTPQTMDLMLPDPRTAGLRLSYNF
ncbi:TonB-dependent receptor [Microbulbifer hydrolyticus]|uniref:Outer membrane receptor protein involved in Fe transport n=1 Tax=Microbulbifer hydrolyticus TaxID=48074 RepID=A0A6P1TDG0_9GAMM|nr:TonB-dependent receptor [Microbulbifer hydrolyticus]MBB5210156.1 outer membrane receptor protein involved in Fe transport [Microbulbifer hydrolyticus]QHQ39329.1 TonB-dependent receptor [Microbulbifer hydrolyticus]